MTTMTNEHPHIHRYRINTPVEIRLSGDYFAGIPPNGTDSIEIPGGANGLVIDEMPHSESSFGIYFHEFNERNESVCGHGAKFVGKQYLVRMLSFLDSIGLERIPNP